VSIILKDIPSKGEDWLNEGDDNVGLMLGCALPAPIWRTHGKYRKQMKRGYPKILYHQRNKNETIISVIKRLFGECLTSRLTRTQNRELSFRCIAYNMHRLTNLVIIVMVST
jgi:hypothetical protein